MNPRRSLTLLHLSDLQFGPKHRFDGTGPDSLFARLRDDFEDVRERRGLVPDLILVTGDLVEHGKPSEFKQFKAFAEATVEYFGLPRRRLVMIPGNHDISRAAAEGYFKDCEADERSPEPPYWPKLRHYAAMFGDFYAADHDITFTEGTPYSLFEYPELGVLVAGLNSAIADSHRAEDHYGFLGEPQLRHFTAKLRQAADQGLFRIAALHHHPTHPEGDRARQDLRDLKRFLGPYLNLVVHGHIHEDELDWLDNCVPILGIGSAGVKAPQRPEEVPNQYQWICVSADAIEFGSRAYVPDQKRYIDDLRPDRAGTQWWQRKTVSFERVSSFTAPGSIATVDDTLARAVASYRSSLARQLRRRPLLIDLATYGEDSDLGHGLELLTIFVPQRASQELPRSDRPDARRPGDHDRFDEMGNEAAPEQLVDEIVVSAAHPWVLILGTPGAGKTFLTMWLALKLCLEGEQFGGLSPDLVPVRIELRLFIERWSKAHVQGRSYDFFDYLDDLHREESRALRGDALRELAAHGRLLWLFDGLDEIANPNARVTIADMIAGVRTAHGGRGVITGRIVGCRHLQGRFHEAGVDCFTLLDLSDPQIADFTARWHSLAFPHAPDLGARRLERLRQALAGSAVVRDLCRNPLLLTLIALLNRGDELPRRRHKLFERASELMLSQWETNKELSAEHPVQFDPIDKRRYLAQLAWHMLTELPEGPGNVLEHDDLERFTVDFCQRHFQARPQPATATARALIQHLRERNYVLGFLGGSKFGFLHKAFFEYFAAEEVVHRFRSRQWESADLQRTFADRWHDDRWSEVLPLICGLLQEVSSEPVVAVVQVVLAAPPLTDRDLLFGSLVFAVQCLGEVRRLESDPARALCLALNRHIHAVLRFKAVMRPEHWYDDIFIDGDPLKRAFRGVGGLWPGVEEVLTAAIGNDGGMTADEDTLTTFLDALADDTRLSWYLRLIQAHHISYATLAESVKGDDESARLWELLNRQSSWSSTLTLAVGNLFLVGPSLLGSVRVRVPASIRVDLAPPVMRDELHRIHHMRGENPPSIIWQQRLNALARLAMTGLSLEPPTHRIQTLHWPILQGLQKPTAQDVDHIKLALGPDFERPDLQFAVACRWRDEEMLRSALASGAFKPWNVFPHFTSHYNEWPGGFDIALEWLRRGDADSIRIGKLLEMLHRPNMKVGVDEVAGALRCSVQSDGATDWRALSECLTEMRMLHTDEVLRLVDLTLDCHTQQPLAVALRLLSCTVDYSPDGEEVWDHTLLERFLELFRSAFAQRPWLALAHFRDLPKEELRHASARCTDPAFAARLHADELTGLDDSRVYFAAMAARKIPGLPWKRPLEHLLERGTDVQLQVDAALELDDWSWLRGAASQEAALAALTVAETLADIQRVGAAKAGTG